VTSGAEAARGPTDLISVIVPVHNGAELVGRALASILAQTYPAVEAIVVDDGSNDASRSVVAAVGDVRLINQPNVGVAGARNTGVRAATGHYLSFLDQDDAWLPDKLRRQVDHLAAHPGVDLVLVRQRPIMEAGVEPLHSLAPDRVYGDVGGVLPPTMLVRRESFDRVGPFDESIPGCDDVDWLFRARAAGLHIEVLDEVLMERHIHADNQSRQVDLVQGVLDAVTRLVAARRPGDTEATAPPTPPPR
jgi:glycosyltransferase involved in cell wall biosynthesis